MDIDEPSPGRVAAKIRARLVELSSRSGAPHLASCLSCVDLLVAVYWGPLRGLTREGLAEPGRDQFILSKGHAAPALYLALAERGLLDETAFEGFAKPGAVLAEQPAPFCAPGVEWATGSLGHGLGVAVGKALANRIHRRGARFLVLMSDGECNEGSVWEAAMFAPAQRLGNLLVLVDFNKWQATDRSCEVMALEPLAAKWESFGWAVAEIDGHDHGAIAAALADFPRDDGRPTAIVAHTVKGKGVPFMEDDNNWHYRIPTAEEAEESRRLLLGPA
jgi:transketolase